MTFQDDVLHEIALKRMINKLRTVLYGTYVILIVLLLLAAPRRSRTISPSEPLVGAREEIAQPEEQPVEQPTQSEAPQPAPPQRAEQPQPPTQSIEPIAPPQPEEQPQPAEEPVEEEPVEEEEELIERAEEVGGSGKLKVTLMWNFVGDVDVHVKQPTGQKIYYDRKVDNVTTGALDRDNEDGGPGSAENIYWTNPPRGTYHVEIDYFKVIQSGVGGTCYVVIKQEGKADRTISKVLTPENKTQYIGTITVE